MGWSGSGRKNNASNYKEAAKTSCSSIIEEKKAAKVAEEESSTLEEQDDFYRPSHFYHDDNGDPYLHYYYRRNTRQHLMPYDLIDHHGSITQPHLFPTPRNSSPSQISNYEDHVIQRELHAVNNNNDDDSDAKKKGVYSSCTLEPLPYYNPSWSRRYWSRSERGGPSSATCVICMEVQSIAYTLESPSCIHRFCKICIKTYLADNIQKDINRVKCPESKCEVALGMDFCKSLVPKHVFAKWRKAVMDSQALVLTCLMRCPLRGCAAVFLDDNSGSLSRACPDCCRYFCVRCKDGWHYGKTCEQYQRSNSSKSLFGNLLPRGIMMSNAKRD